MAFAASTNAQRVRPAELARMAGVSRQSIHELISRRIIERGTDGLVDVDLARHAIANRVRPSAKSAALVQPSKSEAPAPSAQAAHGNEPASSNTAITSYHVAKTLRETAEAKIAQLKLEEMRGNLVRREVGERAVMELFRVLRDSCLSQNQSTALKVVGLVELREIKLHLDDGYRHAFADAERRITEWMQRTTLPAKEAA